MPAQPVPWPFPFSGLNLTLDPRHAPAEALVECTNLYYTGPDRLRSRGGIEYQHTCGTDDITHLYRWSYDGNIYAADDAAGLYKGAAAIGGVVANVTDISSFGVGATPVLIVCEDVAANSLHQYTGAAYTAVAGATVPAVHKTMARFSRLFGTCDPNWPSRVWWSDAGDYTQWEGGFNKGGFVDAFPGYYGGIRDWLEYDGVLYILKEEAVCRLVGDSPATYGIEMVEHADQVLPRMACDVGVGALFATKFGVFPFGRKYASETQDLTREVEDTLLPFLNVAGVNCAYSPQMTGLVLVNGTATGWMSNIASRPDAWTHLTFPAPMSCVYQGDGLWFGSTAGKVYKYDHTAHTDDGLAFLASAKTVSWDLGDRLHKKALKTIDGDMNAAENATCRVEIFKDHETTAHHSFELRAGERNIHRTNINLERVGLRFVFNDLTGPCILGPWRMWVEPNDASL